MEYYFMAIAVFLMYIYRCIVRSSYVVLFVIFCVKQIVSITILNICVLHA